jgi:antitoxin component YwqK of YwqJK toxin-antitoxin module
VKRYIQTFLTIICLLFCFELFAGELLPYQVIYKNGAFFYRQNQQPASGTLLEFYTPENIAYETPLVDGKAHGLQKRYYKSGGIKEEVVFVNGVQEGTMKSYYENGTLNLETPFQNNKIHGVEKMYGKSGHITAELLHEKGVLTSGYMYENGNKRDLTQTELESFRKY